MRKEQITKARLPAMTDADRAHTLGEISAHPTATIQAQPYSQASKIRIFLNFSSRSKYTVPGLVNPLSMKSNPMKRIMVDNPSCLKNMARYGANKKTAMKEKIPRKTETVQAVSRSFSTSSFF